MSRLSSLINIWIIQGYYRDYTYHEMDTYATHSEGYGDMNNDIFKVNFYKHHCDVIHGFYFKLKLGSLINELGGCIMHSTQIVILWLPRQIFLHWPSVHHALDRVAFINFRLAKYPLISSNLTMHSMAVLGISF